MFKERLKEVGSWITTFALVIVIIGVVITPFIVFPVLFSIFSFFVPVVVLGIIPLIFAAFILKYVCKFIYWLFIEPFRKKNRK